jgi:hypothetical protein
MKKIVLLLAALLGVTACATKFTAATHDEVVSLPPFKTPAMKKMATSFTLLDGMAYWCEGKQSFVYRPALDHRPPRVVFDSKLNGLNGELAFFLLQEDGTRLELDSSRIVRVERKPYYMRIEYNVPALGGIKALELLSVPNTHALLYRWSDGSGGPYRFSLKVTASSGNKNTPYTTKWNSFQDSKRAVTNLGRSVYSYDATAALFLQQYENKLSSGNDRLEPCSGLAFFAPPAGQKLIPAKTDDENRNDQNPSATQGVPNKTVKVSKAFVAEYKLQGGGDVVMAYAFADTPDKLNETVQRLRASSFAQWKNHVESYWRDYLAKAHHKIEQRMGISLNALTPAEQAVLDVNLIECRLLLSSNGAMYACPAAAMQIEHKHTGYYQSWIRDDSIAKMYLSSIGLADEYLPPHAALVAHNFMEGTVGGQAYRWWDTFYNFRDGATQVDSAFYGTWSFYKAWKETGDASHISGDRYQLMKDTLHYMRNVQDVGPVTKKNVVYYDPNKKLFCEVRINEADITFDKPVWYRSPKTQKKFQFVDSFYINVLFYANYRMLAEIAQYHGLQEEGREFLNEAEVLKKAMDAQLWRPDKGRYIAGMAYNEDGYEDIDFNWENIGFDYIWALTLPDNAHLPFGADVKRRCLEAAWKNQAWARTVFGMAEIATDLPAARANLMKDIVDDALTVEASGSGTHYYFPFVVPECERGLNLPQIFAIAPALRALCLLAADRQSAGPVAPHYGRQGHPHETTK